MIPREPMCIETSGNGPDIIQLPEPNSAPERLLIRTGRDISFLMESFAMRLHQSLRCARIVTIAAAVLTTSVSASGQSGQLRLEGVIQSTAQAAAREPAENVRRLSIDEAVKLGLEQNLGIQIQRLDPQIQDVGIAQARSFWSPQLTSGFSRQSQSQAPTSSLSGAATSIDNGRFASTLGLNQNLPWGAAYSANWNSSRFTTNNLFSSFSPQLS